MAIHENNSRQDDKRSKYFVSMGSMQLRRR
jgi:hypothetical protein